MSTQDHPGSEEFKAAMNAVEDQLRLVFSVPEPMVVGRDRSPRERYYDDLIRNGVLDRVQVHQLFNYTLDLIMAWRGARNVNQDPHWCTNCEGVGVQWCAFNPAVSPFADSARDQGVSYQRSRWRRLLDPWSWRPRPLRARARIRRGPVTRSSQRT